MLLRYSKNFFLILIFSLVIILFYNPHENKTEHILSNYFKNQNPDKFIRYECVKRPCGGWGKNFLVK